MYLLENVRKVFPDGLVAVDGVSLKVTRGERLAIIGPSGAGKTTLFRMLNCTVRPTSGRLLFDGVDVETLSGRQLRQVRRRIGTIYQQHNLVSRLPVIHNVLAGRLGTWSFLQALGSLMRPTDQDLAYGALRRVGIPDKLYTRTDELSGGQQQRVAIARTLVQDPEVILADEPVSSVDPSLARGIVTLLLQISEASRKTLITNLHSVELALAHFPRIIGLAEGKVLFDGTPAEVTAGLLQDLYRGQEEAEREVRDNGGWTAHGCGPFFAYKR